MSVVVARAESEVVCGPGEWVVDFSNFFVSCSSKGSMDTPGKIRASLFCFC